MAGGLAPAVWIAFCFAVAESLPLTPEVGSVHKHHTVTNAGAKGGTQLHVHAGPKNKDSPAVAVEQAKKPAVAQAPKPHAKDVVAAKRHAPATPAARAAGKEATIAAAVEEEREQAPHVTVEQDAPRELIVPAKDPAPEALCLKRLWSKPCAHGCPASATCHKESGLCQCGRGACGEATGQCHRSLSERADFDMRLAPHQSQNEFLRAIVPQPDTSKEPTLAFIPGWPEEIQRDAIFNVVVQPDNQSALISSWYSWELKPTRVLDLEAVTFRPRLVPLESAGQAEWRFADGGGGHKVFMKHVRTGRYLAVIDKEFTSPDGTALLQKLGSGVHKLNNAQLVSLPMPIAGSAFDVWPQTVMENLAEYGLLEPKPHWADSSPAQLIPHAENAPAHFKMPWWGWLIVAVGLLLVCSQGGAQTAILASTTSDDVKKEGKAKESAGAAGP